MSAVVPPRVVLVTRETELELLLARHGTRAQAEFVLRGRGRSLGPVEQADQQQRLGVHAVLEAVPRTWRMSRVTRSDLPRFLFEPDDTIVAVGQDGLVANVAKYLDGQPVLGVNPSPELFEGVLVPLPPAAVADLLPAAAERRVSCEHRAMVEVMLDDGRQLRALNEIYLGHRSHQSARYLLNLEGRCERQSSSGLIVATGTGSTGWARSIARERAHVLRPPDPEERRLSFFVREAFPSVATEVGLTAGQIREDEELVAISQMSEGVLFGDGLEDDRLAFEWGSRASLKLSDRRLELVAA